METLQKQQPHFAVSSISQFASDVTMTFAVKTITLVIGVATGIILARALGPSGRGAYALIATFPGLVLAFVHLGIAQANVYYLRKTEVKVEPAVIRANTLLLTVIVSAVTLAVLWVIKPLLFSTVLKELDPKFYFVILAIMPFFILETFANSLLVAYERFRLINSIGFLLRIFDTVAIVVVLLALHMGLWGAAIVLLGINVTSALLNTYFAFRGGPFARPDLGIIARSLRFGIKSHVQTLTGFLHYKIDIFLLALFLTTTEVGYYSIAVGLVSLIFFIPESVGTVLFPRLAGLRDDDANEFTAKVCRNTLFVTALPALGILVFGRVAIRLMYGAEYLPAIAALYFLIPGIIAMCIYKVLSRNFTSRNKQQVTIIAGVLGLVVNVALNVILIPALGITGAALATTISYSITSLLLLFSFLKTSRYRLIDTVLINRCDFAQLYDLLGGAVTRQAKA